jgi:hypothetical protein
LLTAVSLEYISGKVGILIHKELLFAPFKLLDSLLGALIVLVKNLILIFLIATVLLSTYWQMPTDYIENSYVYTYLNKVLSKTITYLRFKTHNLI